MLKRITLLICVLLISGLALLFKFSKEEKSANQASIQDGVELTSSSALESKPQNNQIADYDRNQISPDLALDVPNPSRISAPQKEVLVSKTNKEQFYESGKLVEQRDSKPDAKGVFKRVSIIEKVNFKYPFIRIEETVSQPVGSETQTILSSRSMVADHLIIKLDRGKTQKDLEGFVKGMGGELSQFIPNSPLYLVSLPSLEIGSFEVALDFLNQGETPAAYSEPDYIVHAHAGGIPNDPSFDDLWGLHNVGQAGGVGDADVDGPEAWQVETGDEGVVVGIIDTGVDYLHEDLSANMWVNSGEIADNGIDDDGNGYIDDVHGWDFANDDQDPMDDQYHGTHCAGTVGAVGNNGIGVVGVAQSASLMALKFLSAEGSGATSDAVGAVYYATNNGAHLTSNSWGGGGYSQSLKDAIDDAATQGLLFVAAAGNATQDTDASPSYPASYDSENIISVASTDRYDNLSYFSNYGASNVDLGAPGSAIYSCSPNNGYRELSGTSMAAPHVSGALVLLKSLNPTANWQDLKIALLGATDEISSLAGKTQTGGRLNIANALVVASGPYLTLSQHQTNDSLGNANGILNPGEDIDLDITFKNIGSESADTVTSVLSLASADPYITLLNSTSNLGTIPSAGQSSNATTPFRFSIAPGTPTPHDVSFLVTNTDNLNNQWQFQVDLTVYSSSVISGQVSELSGGVPITSAIIDYTGSNSGSVLVDSNGSYSIDVIDGSYTLVARASGFVPSEAVSVTTPPSNTSVDFQLGVSSIQVSPASVTSTQFEDTVTNHTVTLSNQGDSPLTFSISGLPTGVTLASFSSGDLSPSPNPMPTSEESPEDGRFALVRTLAPPIAGLAMNLPYREGWEDGDFSDWIIDGTIGTREVVNTTSSKGNYSFHYDYPGTTDHRHGVHQNFAVGSQPKYISFNVRSGSTETHDGYFALYDSSSGASPIFFFARGNGHFYINDDTGGDNTVPYNSNEWYYIEFRNIDWGTKSFDYYVDGALIKTGVSFRSASSVNGITGVSLYNFSTNSEAWWDEIVISNYAINWLTISPTAGTISPGSSQNINLTFDSNGVAPGTYTADLLVNSNDPNTPVVIVPLTLIVTPIPNDPPVADNQTFTINEDTTRVVTLTGSDPDGNALVARITTLPASGTLYQTADGLTKGAVINGSSLVTNTDLNVIYEPALNGSGIPYSSFQFLLNDGRLDSNTATVTINVAEVNDLPIARNDNASALPGESISVIRVLSNDFDPDDANLTISSFTQGVNGTVANNGDGTLSYVPSVGFIEGGDQFTYTITDSFGASSTAFVLVRLGGLAGGDWNMFGRDAAHSGYYPASTGGQTFTESWQHGPFTTSLNHIAVANEKVYITDTDYNDEMEILALNVGTGTLEWDYDFGHNYRVSPPSHSGGVITVQRSSSTPLSTNFVSAIDSEAGSLLWEETLPAYSGSTVFGTTPTEFGVFLNNYYDLYRLNSETGTQLFNQSVPGQGVNWTPTIAEGQVFVFSDGVLFSYDPDTGVENWNLSVNTAIYGSQVVSYGEGKIYAATSSGLYAIDISSQTISWTAPGSFRGTPAVANGSVYAIYNSNYKIGSFNTSTGNPIIEFNSANYDNYSQIIVTNDTLFASSSYRTTIFDLSSGTEIQSLSTGGNIALYNGFLFIAEKRYSSSNVRCYVLSSDNNDPPTSMAQTYTVIEDSVGGVSLTGTDPQGDVLLAVIVELPTKGTLYQTPDGFSKGEPITTVPALVAHPQMKTLYEPDENGFGADYDSFTFKVNDGVYYSEVATATIDVTGVNDGPRAIDDSYTIRPGDVLPNFLPQSNDYDPDFDNLILESFTQPANGSVSQNADGSLSYTHNVGLTSGIDSFTYIVEDGSGITDAATVSITLDSLVGRDWPTFGNGPEHSGHSSILFRSDILTQKWENDLGVALHQVALEDGRIFVTASSSRFSNNWASCLDEKTGAEIWFHDLARNAPGNYVNPPTVVNGKVYIQRGRGISSNVNDKSDSRLWCFDTADGSELWSSPFSAQWEGYLAPCVADSKVWVNGGYYGGIYGYDALIGTELFFTSLEFEDQWTPSYHDGKLYSFVDGHFRNHHPTDGTINWSLNFDWASGVMYRTVAFEGNTALLISNDVDNYNKGHLIAIDLSNRSVLWREDGLFDNTSTPAVANGVVYAITASGAVNAYSLGTGNLVGAYLTTDNALDYQPIVTTNRLFVASSNQTFVFDLHSRELLQTINYGGRISVANETLYIAGSSGVMRAYGQVDPTNQVPVGVAVEATILEEASVAITLEATDGDDDSLSFVVKSLPSVGTLYQTSDGITQGAKITRVPTLVINSNQILIYQAPLDRFGNNLGDFTFAAADAQSASPVTDVVIHITGVNDSPVAVNDNRTTQPGQILSPLYLTLNDIDVDGDTLSITSFTQPVSGVVVQNSDGSLRYEPDPTTLSGQVSFSYTIADALGIMSTASVIIDVSQSALGSWPTFGNGPAHTGSVPEIFGSSPWTLDWSTVVNTGGINQVAIGDGRVYVNGGYAGYGSSEFVTALDERSGSELWKKPFDDASSMNPPTFDNGAVYFQRGNHSSDTQLWALHSDTGVTKWSRPHSAQWQRYLAPCVAGGGVWINGGSYGGMYGFDSNSGNDRFFKTLAQYDQWTPSYHNGKLYSFVEGKFVNYDPNTGDEIWSVDLSWDWAGWSMYRTVAFDGDFAYLINNSDNYGVIHELVCIDLSNQSVAWRAAGNFTQATPAVSQGVVYAMMGSQVQAYRSNDGSLLGSYETGDTGLRHQPVVSNDLVFVCSTTSTFIFDRYSFTLLQTIPHGGYLSLTGKNLFIAGNDGTVYAYSPTPALTFTPGDATVSVTPLTITIAASDSSATIYYTLDGSAPNLSSLSIPAGGQVVVPMTATIRAISVNGSSFSRIYSSNYTIIDSDGDGLPDWWEFDHFGDLITTDGSLDSDGDGRSDLDEWLADTDPLNGDVFLVIENLDLDVASAQLSFDFKTSADRNYCIESSPDLLNWTKVGDWMTGTGTLMSYVDTDNAPLEIRKFYRIAVQP